MGWADILPHWRLVVVDLHQVYGADWHDPALEGRRWPWWRERIWGLLTTDSRLNRALFSRQPQRA